MTRLSIKLEGEKALQVALDDLSDDIQQAVSNVVLETAAEIEAGVKLRMQQGPATGRTYKRRSVVHRASAPGEPPAPDTGVLLGSIYHERAGQFSAVVGSRLAYAAFLEWGTFKMAPRPAWTPEVESAKQPFYADIERAIAGEIR
ncbi:MAG: hypothetical protein GOVbin4685_7 [Prokaryotic dsDNA virus sp.]|jgi:phage gpG-like protein|nr:MAG: hypothetical protein GOVbin4685_7 [Prokaryotic dsDNA virus sp.]|tara:strand:- start:12042 stop:12476 length:435 start_codon:yes stop_codon:yes gene_type:complete